MYWSRLVGESEEIKTQYKGCRRPPETVAQATGWSGVYTHQVGGESQPLPEKTRRSEGPKRAESRRQQQEKDGAGFLGIESDDIADLTLLLLLKAGDVEQNPGPKKTTVRNRPTTDGRFHNQSRRERDVEHTSRARWNPGGSQGLDMKRTRDFERHR